MKCSSCGSNDLVVAADQVTKVCQTCGFKHVPDARPVEVKTKAKKITEEVVATGDDFLPPHPPKMVPIDGVQYSIIPETITVYTETGQKVQRKVLDNVDPSVDSKYIPDRELDEAKLEFMRFLFRDQVALDQRWAKGNLKMRGFRYAGREMVNGESLRQWVHESDFPSNAEDESVL